MTQLDKALGLLHIALVTLKDNGHAGLQIATDIREFMYETSGQCCGGNDDRLVQVHTMDCSAGLGDTPIDETRALLTAASYVLVARNAHERTVANDLLRQAGAKEVDDD